MRRGQAMAGYRPRASSLAVGEGPPCHPLIRGEGGRGGGGDAPTNGGEGLGVGGALGAGGAGIS